MKFYRNLFTNEYGKQIAQLIIATHSQYIVQEAMKDSDNVKVILLKKEGIETKANVIDKAVLGMYSSAEINYLAFGVEKKDYHIQLFSALHNKLQNIPENEVNAHIASIDCYIKIIDYMIQLDMKKRTRHIIIIIHCLYLSEMQLIIQIVDADLVIMI